MNNLPPAYGWIDDLRPLPRMLREARKLYGTFEAAGPADNPLILSWAKEVGLAKAYNDVCGVPSAKVREAMSGHWNGSLGTC